jgi:hypothetical protein
MAAPKSSVTRRVVFGKGGSTRMFGRGDRTPQQQAAYQQGGRRTYTRAQIVDMSKRRMKGLINDADWARWEHQMIAAGREGRILGGLPVGTR